MFRDTAINVTIEGHKHLGAALGSRSFLEEYVGEKVDEWVKVDFGPAENQANLLSHIQKIKSDVKIQITLQITLLSQTAFLFSSSNAKPEPCVKETKQIAPALIPSWLLVRVKVIHHLDHARIAHVCPRRSDG